MNTVENNTHQINARTIQNINSKIYSNGIMDRCDSVLSAAAIKLRMLDERYHHSVFLIEGSGRQGNAVEVIKKEKVINFHSNEAETLIYTKGLVSMHTCEVDPDAELSSLLTSLESAVHNVIGEHRNRGKSYCFSFDTWKSGFGLLDILDNIWELRLHRFNVFYCAEAAILTVFN